MTSHPLLLLPPSAGKAIGGRGDPWRHSSPHRFADLVPQRQAVRAAVDRQIRRRTDLAKLFAVSERALADALSMWRALDGAPTLPAYERYTGVVWTALDPGALTTSARRRLRQWVLVVSGLWGLVGAEDALPPYRLPIGSRAGEIGGLGTYWREHLGPVLERTAGRAWVFDLLPDDHAVAIDGADIRRCRIHIVTDGVGGTRAVGHAGKAVKGRLARAILEQGPRTPGALSAIQVPGLTLLDATPGEVVFVADR